MISSIVNGIPAVPATTSPAASSAESSAAAIDPLASEQTFLKLFVAQLQNQDPLQPQDGAQFVAQLAQFSSLEQEVQMREDLDNIKNSGALPIPNPAPTPSVGPTATPQA